LTRSVKATGFLKMIRNSEQNYEILRFMAENNPAVFNFNKALEEGGEFAEVLLKNQTKSDLNPRKPSITEAIKEYGDQQYRGFVALMTLFPEASIDSIELEISNHIDYKLNNLIKYRQEGKYHGGL